MYEYEESLDCEMGRDSWAFMCWFDLVFWWTLTDSWNAGRIFYAICKIYETICSFSICLEVARICSAGKSYRFSLLCHPPNASSPICIYTNSFPFRRHKSDPEQTLPLTVNAPFTSGSGNGSGRAGQIVLYSSSVGMLLCFAHRLRTR